MDRRRFLQTMAASMLAGTVTGLPVQAGGDGWKEDFHAALREKSWLLGYRTVGRPGFSTARLKVEGSLPPELKGTFFRNGPARHEIGDMRYHHWFDGDGMVQAFRFDGESVSHHARMVETEKYTRELEAGRALVQAFGTDLPEFEPLMTPDEANVANINIIRHNGELLALWEGGSAYRLDAESLDTLGVKTWSRETAGAPFSAHPRVDADGTLWNFGYASTVGALVLYRISPSGAMLDTGVIPVPGMPMVHDFTITERHLVLYLAPYYFDTAREGAFLDRFDWRPGEGGRVLVIDKNDFTSIREIEAPAMWVFHYANAFEDRDGVIRMQAPVYDSPAIMTETFREVMRGNFVPPESDVRFMTMALDPAKGSFAMEAVDGVVNGEFPRIDMRLQGRRHRFSYIAQAKHRMAPAGFDTILRIDHDRETTVSYRYPDTEMAEEHVFTPRPGSTGEGDGWLIGTSFDYVKGHTILNIFRADALADGPVARMPLPYAVPLGLHGNFYAA